MYIHQKRQRPLIIIDFDKAIYRDGYGFKQINFYKQITPRIHKRMLYLLDTVKNRYDICLFSKNYFLEAICWTIRNQLDKDCIKSVISRKCRCTYFLEKI